MGIVRTQLGQLYEAAGSYERARELCGGDRPLAPQITHWQNIVHNLVLVLLDLGRREDAQVHARRRTSFRKSRGQNIVDETVYQGGG